MIEILDWGNTIRQQHTELTQVTDCQSHGGYIASGTLLGGISIVYTNLRAYDTSGHRLLLTVSNISNVQSAATKMGYQPDKENEGIKQLICLLCYLFYCYGWPFMYNNIGHWLIVKMKLFHPLGALLFIALHEPPQRQVRFHLTRTLF